jgi:tRNA (guanine37-N1)-methyltransferase
MKVPDVLISGDHGRVEQWRREQARLRTAQRRPELLMKRGAAAAQRQRTESRELRSEN